MNLVVNGRVEPMPEPATLDGLVDALHLTGQRLAIEHNGHIVPRSLWVQTALRLARFNTNLTVVDKRYFQGLPSPAAAAVVMGFIWVMDDAGYQQADMQGWLAWTAMAFTLLAGLTMVTNLPFYSFKEFSLKRTVPFIVIVALALAIALVNLHPPIVLFAVFCLYAGSGYGIYVWKRMKGRPVSVIATSTDEPEEQGLHR